jgi:predicted secreted Zn-dependent protease
MTVKQESRVTRTMTACVLTGLAVGLAGCSATGNPKPDITVGYYEVSGRTTKAIDRQLALHGPYVPGKGRVLAATDISLIPRIVLEEQPGKCALAQAQFQVKAKVTLPKWRQRKSARGDIADTWDNFAAYAAVHELVHIRIAEDHADKLSRRLNKLPTQADCKTLGKKIDAVVKAIEAEHGRAQDKFDADEAKRFDRLVAEADARS